MWPLPMMHWTSLYRTPNPLQTWDMGTPSLPHGDPLSQSPASDIWWPSLETFSNVFIVPHCTDPPLVLTSGGY